MPHGSLDFLLARATFDILIIVRGGQTEREPVHVHARVEPPLQLSIQVDPMMQ